MSGHGVAEVASPPRFCTIDGMALEDKRTDIRSGFDPFTGIERPRREHVTLECPTRGHDVWVLVGDRWVRP